ncbi:MAG: hypothetical protein CHACPFDD_02056 [Phycisphaerae bacterium]|nr:hypothetical protein [Phycisphaerae bacterium]
MNWMGKLSRAGRAFFADDSGPTATEYAVMLALIVLVAAAAIQGIGTRIWGVYEGVNHVMPDAT